MNLDKIKKNEEGVTLIEILVAMMIFSFIVGGIVLFGVRAIESHTKSQATQNVMENARFAIESMSKRIRTSSEMEVSGGGDEIYFKSNANDLAYCYRFDSVTEELLMHYDDDVSLASLADCIYPAPLPLLGSADIKITGGFEIKETDETGGSRGLARVMMKIVYRDITNYSETDVMAIQSTVSSRDNNYE